MHNLPVAPHFAVELPAHALCALSHGLMLVENLPGGSLTDLGLDSAANGSPGGRLPSAEQRELRRTGSIRVPPG